MRNHGRRQPEPRRAGLTLIELLAVMFILAILVALVVGVGRYVIDDANKRKTQQTLTVLKEAVQSYHDAASPKAYPDGNGDDASAAQIFSALTSPEDSPRVQAAMERIRRLPEDAMETGGSANVFLDAWGRKIRYDKDGGFGGRPVFISAGSDGDFGTDDDIRSD